MLMAEVDAMLCSHLADAEMGAQRGKVTSQSHATAQSGAGHGNHAAGTLSPDSQATF